MIAATRSILLACLAAALFVTPSASAQESARAYLEARHEDVTRLLRQPESERRAERLRTLLSGLLDYEELSRRSLGEHWDAQSEAARARFVELLRSLVERNYEGNLERIVDFEVSYDRETTRGELVVVHTTARSRTQRRAPPVSIDYTMQREGGEWRVVDVTTDGVSMVDNYRSQFNRIISEDGWDDLISRMERRLEQD